MAKLPKVKNQLTSGDASGTYVPATIITGTGVDKTGATDSSTAIQALLTAAGVGAKIVYPPGTYKVNNLAPLNGQTWEGTGVTLIPAGAASVIYTATVDDFTIRGFIIDGQSTADKGLFIQGGSRLNVDGVYAKNCTYRGMYLGPVNDIRLTNSVLESNGAGGGLNGGGLVWGSRIRVSNVTTRNNNGYGLIVFGNLASPTVDVVLSNVQAIGNTQHGIGTSAERSAYITGLTIIGCVAESNGTAGVYSGISVDMSKDVTVTGCSSRSNQEHGFVLMDSVGAALTGNVAEGNLRFGLRIQGDTTLAQDAYTGVTYAQVTGNTFRNNGNVSDANHGGVWISANCSDVAVVGNNISGNTGASISLSAVASYTDPSNLTLAPNTMSGNSASNAVVSGLVGAYLNTAIVPRVQTYTAGTTLAAPAGATLMRYRVVAAGGGGGGGGSNAAGATQAGGAGGGAGGVVEGTVNVAGLGTITVVVGAAGTAGTAGAAGGNAGGNGGQGGLSSIAATGLSAIAAGGGGGNASTASSSASATGGLFATGSAIASTVMPGCGGPSASRGLPMTPGVCGGAGGGSSNTTLGGTGGAAMTSNTVQGVNAGTAGGSGTAAGTNGTTATQPGAGGGGGGGGTAGTGAGGAGGAGAPGIVVLTFY